MPHKDEKRVLNRMGAHELTQEEMDKIFGAGDRLNTLFSHTQTLPMTNPDSDHDE